jgi:hypothetical protein
VPSEAWFVTKHGLLLESGCHDVNVTQFQKTFTLVDQGVSDGGASDPLGDKGHALVLPNVGSPCPFVSVDYEIEISKPPRVVLLDRDSHECGG